MSNHTPGPLTKLGVVDKCEVGGFVAIGPSGGNPTAYVIPTGDVDLYISAPDMAAALREIAEYPPVGMDASEDLCNVQDIARAALAKVGGA